MAPRFRLALVGVLVLVVAACGDDGGNQPIGELTLPTSVSTTTPPTTTTPSDSACEESAQPIELDTSTPGSIAATVDPYPANALFYCFVITETGLTLTVTLTDLAADADLHLAYGSLDDLRTRSDWSSILGGTNDDVVVIEDAEPGIYYIEVIDFERSGTPFVLEVAAGQVVAGDCDTPAQSIDLDTPMMGNLPATTNTYPANALYFCVEVPAGTSTLYFTLAGMETDLNIYVGFGSIDTVQGLEEGSWEWAGQNTDTEAELVTIDDPIAGTYYIEVFDNFRAGSDFVLTVVAG